MQVSICMLIQMMGRNILYPEMSIELGLAIIVHFVSVHSWVIGYLLVMY